jgi:hypothetical protein
MRRTDANAEKREKMFALVMALCLGSSGLQTNTQMVRLRPSWQSGFARHGEIHEGALASAS